MSPSPDKHLAAIAEHCARFAEAVRGNLDADVQHCPGWTVADLTAHLTEVHWFWGQIVERRLTERPEFESRPERAPDDQLVQVFQAGAKRLLRILGLADPACRVWTWAPAQQDVGFVLRHQVQEAAVHHWDAVHAAGGELSIAAPVATDAIDEFLTFSVASDGDPPEAPLPAPLGGTFTIECSDVEAAWTITDGTAPSAVQATRGATGGVPTVRGTASDLLLWLYGRVDVAPETTKSPLLQRFRKLCYTD